LSVVHVTSATFDPKLVHQFVTDNFYFFSGSVRCSHRGDQIGR